MTTPNPAPSSAAESNHTLPLWPFLGLTFVGLAFAWARRFIQDDAFITFVYSRSLVEGMGPTWFGDRVEGYTNFLWMLWIALGMRAGMEPVLLTQVTGMVLFAVLLWVTGRLALRYGGDSRAAVFAVGLMATNVSVVSYATGGLETMLQALLLASALLCLERPVLLSTLLLLALMTRLDSAAAGFLIGCAGLWRYRAEPKNLMRLVTPVTVGLVLWFGWKMWFYGDPLPNTFYAKVAGFNPNGLTFIGRFVHWYALWPFLLLGLRGLRGLGLLLTVSLSWFAYILWVGGDFMEFRFMVPVASMLFVVLAILLRRHLKPWAQGVALTILVLASVLHGARFRGVSDDVTLDSLTALGNFYGLYEHRPWSAVGEKLARDLDGLDVVLAMHPVGAIPYYSRIKTVDMFGLNDRFVAREGELLRPGWQRPGHRRFAPWSYLMERGVNLVLGNVVELQTGLLTSPEGRGAIRQLLTAARPSDPLFQQASIVAMPLGDGTSVIMVLSQSTPELEARITELGWERLELRRREG